MALSIQPITYRDPFCDSGSIATISVRSQLKTLVHRAERKRRDKIAAEFSFEVVVGSDYERQDSREIVVDWADIEAFAAQENMPASRAIAAIKRSAYWREVFRDFMSYQVGWN